MRKLINNPIIAFLLLGFLTGCGGGDEGTGAGLVEFDNSPPVLESTLQGLESCRPQFGGQSLLCGSVTDADGVTPLPGVEVRINSQTDNDSSFAKLSIRGIADENRCLTDSQGEYACVLPAYINGIQAFNLIPPEGSAVDFVPGSFEVDVQAYTTTIVSPQTLRPKETVSVLEDPTSVRYITSSCGSLPVKTTAPSINQNNPSSALVGTVNNAELGSRNSENSTQYWEFGVTAGSYHLVIDYTSTDFASPLNMNALIFLPEEAKFQHVIEDSSVYARRMRRHVPITIEGDMSLLVMTRNNSATNIPYQIGLFEADSAVPAPFFSNCPDIVNLSIGATESSSLEPWGERWFSLEMTPGKYEVSVLTYGAPTAIYRVDIYRDFAQQSTEINLADVSELIDGTNLSQTNYVIEKSGLVYFRVRNYYAGFITEFELTVNKL